MAKIGLDTELQLEIPNKGDTDWTELIRTAFEAIATHTHSGVKTGTKIVAGSMASNLDFKSSDTEVTLKNNEINADELNTDSVTTIKIKDSTGESDGVTNAKLADNNITVDKKRTYEIASLSGSAENVTAIATGDVMKINYRIKRGSTYQIGTINAHASGPNAGYIQDEFIGDDLHDPDGDKLVFTIVSNYIQVEGKSADELIYSIEFKENTTA